MAYSNFGAQFQAFVIRVANSIKELVTKTDTLTSNITTLNTNVVKTINNNKPTNGNISPTQTGCLPLSGGMVNGNVTIQYGYRGLVQQLPASAIYTDHAFLDSDGNLYGNIRVTKDANGKCYIGISANGKDASGATTWNTLEVGSNDDGSSPYIRFAGDAVLTAKTGLLLGGGNIKGNLTVQSKNVVRSVNGTAAGTDGNVTLTKADITDSLGYTPLQTAPVTSVNGKTGAVTITEGGTSAYKIPYATCSTALSTTAKVATITNSVSLTLVAGAMVVIKYTNDPYDATISTLNVNSTGAKTVKRYYRPMIGTGETDSYDFSHTNKTYLYVYDGTYWNELSVADKA